MVHNLQVQIMRILILSVFLLLAGIGCKKQRQNIISGSDVRPTDFLTSEKYEKITIEVVHVTGFKPTAGSISNLHNFLNELINKPGGIEIVYHESAPFPKSVITLEDIKEKEKKSRQTSNNDNTMSAFILFSNGEYAGNSNNSSVLGIAYGASSMVIFEETIRKYSGGLAQPSTESIEKGVINHEFGHILGLVNNGVEPVAAHQDAANGRHCNNKGCLMYYATETSDILSNLIGGEVPGLDANCRNDLRAAGGK
jgi:hypothetical protein